MKELGEYDKPTAELIRVVVLTQLIAFLWRGIVVAIEDAPEVFRRVGADSFIWPIVVLFLLFAFNFDRRLAEFGSRNLFVVLASIVSISTTILAFVELAYHFDIPNYLLTESRQYLQKVSVVTLIIYLLALGLTFFFSIRALRSSLNTPSSQ